MKPCCFRPVPFLIEVRTADGREGPVSAGAASPLKSFRRAVSRRHGAADSGSGDPERGHIAVNVIPFQCQSFPTRSGLDEKAAQAFRIPFVQLRRQDKRMARADRVSSITWGGVRQARASVSQVRCCARGSQGRCIYKACPRRRLSLIGGLFESSRQNCKARGADRAESVLRHADECKRADSVRNTAESAAPPCFDQGPEPPNS